MIQALVALEQLQKDVGDIYTAHRLSVLEQVSFLYVPVEMDLIGYRSEIR